MMVKIKEENEDDEDVKSSNKSSTPLLLPRLANGRTSLCLLLLWCWCCFLVIIAFLFFFYLTRTLCIFQGAHKATKTRKFSERDVCCFSLSLVPLGVGLSRLDDQKKKKNQHACIYFAGTNNVSHALHARKASVVIARVAVPVAP